MKRADFIRYLGVQGCILFREGAKHSVFVNLKTGRSSTIPRHREIDNFLVRKICRDLEVKEVKF